MDSDHTKFYVTLPSDASMVTGLKTKPMSTYLPNPLHFNRHKLEVGVSQVQIPVTWRNVHNPLNTLSVSILTNLSGSRGNVDLPFAHACSLTIPEGHCTGSQLVVVINESLQMGIKSETKKLPDLDPNEFYYYPTDWEFLTIKNPTVYFKLPPVSKEEEKQYTRVSKYR